MAKHSLKEIMQMEFDDLEECIASMSTDDPRLDFALKQRDFLSQRYNHKLTYDQHRCWHVDADHLLRGLRCRNQRHISTASELGHSFLRLS